MSDLATSAPASASGLDPRPRPYPGLRAFNRDEWPLFFGRETMAEAVLLRLQRHRLVVVHGSSGSGKSSLIFAGVLPQLQRRRHRQGARLAILSLRPGNAPLRTLASALHGLAREAGTPDERPADAPGLDDLRIILARGRQAATDLEALVSAAGYDQLCLYIDQFEELFRFAREGDADEAQLFADLLVGLSGPDPEDADSGDLADAPDAETARTEPAPAQAVDAIALPKICAVLTMRSEFFGDCARFQGLAETVNRTQYLLPTMKRSDLVRAIREPAARFGGSVAWDLADRLARDAAREEDPLPLVQHALMGLWDKYGQQLTLEQYEAETTPKEADRSSFRTGLGRMLASHADKVLATAAPDKERGAVAEHVFRALTDIDREGRAVRREQRLDRLRSVVDPAGTLLLPILDAFRADGVSFLRPSPTERPVLADDDVVDIGHEALIRSWPRIADRSANSEGLPHGWLHREFQDGLAWRALAARAFEHKKFPELPALPPATTESLWPWFEAVRRRPAWTRRYLIESVPGLSVEEQPEWQAVTRLMEASHKAWRNQLSRLDDEEKLRTAAETRAADLRLQRNHRLIPALLFLLAMTVALGITAARGWKVASDEAKKAADERDLAEATSIDALKVSNAAQKERDQAQREREQSLADVAALASDVQEKLQSGSLAAVRKAIGGVVAPYLRERPATDKSEAVSETPTDAALQLAAKVTVNTPVLLHPINGFMWIGSEQYPRLSDPNSGKPIAPEAVLPGSLYTVTRPTVLREDMPAEDTYRTAASKGIVEGGSLLQVLGTPKGYQRPSGTQFWVRLQVQPDPRQITTGYRAAALDALLSYKVKPATEALSNILGKRPWQDRLISDAGTLQEPSDSGSLSPAQAMAWKELYRQLADDKAFLAGVPADLVKRLESTIGTAPEPQPTVWFQFSGATRDEAQKISAELKQSNYVVPGEDRQAMTDGLREVRYFYPGDKSAAERLAADTCNILDQLGYRQSKVAVKDYTSYPTKPQPGLMELWLALPTTPSRPAADVRTRNQSTFHGCAPGPQGGG